MSNPFIGVLFHWIGGFAAGSFYAPYRKVRNWAWETYWLAGGIVSWIIAPWLLASILTPQPWAILSQAPASTLLSCFCFGVLWGIGGLTFGLAMRYLGISLGMAVALGYCAVFGTLMPPLFEGTFSSKVLGTPSGLVTLLGMGVCVVGIAVAGLAGMAKEGEMSAAHKPASLQEFNFKKGVLVATFAGILSACMAFGLARGEPIRKIALEHGTGTLWQGLPVLIIVLFGGFTTNCVWCLALNIRNKTGYQYFSPALRAPLPERVAEPILENATDAPGMEVMAQAGETPLGRSERDVPLLLNWAFCALAGLLWYLQFFFYTMGESQMGAYGFSSWTIHMASIILFSTIWGIALKEWKGASRRSLNLLSLGLGLLVLSTVIVGYGNYLGVVPTGH